MVFDHEQEYAGTKLQMPCNEVEEIVSSNSSKNT